MPRWDFRYQFAGRDHTEENVSAAWVERSSVMAATAFVSTVRVRINPPFDFAAVAVSANPLSGTGILSRVGANGTSKVVFRGRFTRTAYGGTQDPVEITLSRSSLDDTALIPSAYELTLPLPGQDFLRVFHTALKGANHPYLDETNWTGAPASRDIGRTYPLIFGGPGDANHPGSPCVIVDQPSGDYQIMMAGHSVTPQSFEWWYPQAVIVGGVGTGETVIKQISMTASDITHIEDARGRVVAVFTIDPAADSVDLDVDRVGGYFMAWTGGKAAPDGAGDVIARVMRSSSVRMDFQRSAAALNRLNAYKLDGYIDEQVPPLEWVTRTLMPLLPASLHTGPDGLVMRLWPWLDGGDAAAHHITTGTDFAPASLVQYTTASAGTVTLKYKWQPDVSDYAAAVTASADESLWGVVAGPLNSRTEKLETRAVWDDGTARRIVQDRVRYGAIPSRTRRYTCDPDLYGIGGKRELRAGMPIKITDAEVAWTSLLAWIDEIERHGEAMSVTVRIREW